MLNEDAAAANESYRCFIVVAEEDKGAVCMCLHPSNTFGLLCGHTQAIRDGADTVATGRERKRESA